LLGGSATMNSLLAANYVTFNTSPAYTPYFTPGNAADTCAGVLAWYADYASTTVPGTLTVRLLEGATVRATATATIDKTVGDNNSNGQGYIFFKFATPYTYGNTTPNTWRFSFTHSVAHSISLRNATGTSNVGFVEVLTTTQAPAANDTLVITGATDGGVITSNVVTVDSSIALGTVGSTFLESIQISKGGTLTYGTSQAASYTLTINNNLRICSSKSNEFGFEMGTVANPLTSTYIQTLTFVNATASGLSVFGYSDGNRNLVVNKAPPRISVVGNYAFNRSAETIFRGTLASDAAAGATTIVFTEDIGLRAGGGDLLALNSKGTGGYKRCEKRTTTAYDSATKTATIPALTYAHATGGTVLIGSCNAVMTSSSATYGAYFKMTASASYQRSTYPDCYPYIQLRNVEVINFPNFVYVVPVEGAPDWQYIAIHDLTVGNQGIIGGGLQHTIKDVNIIVGEAGNTYYIVSDNTPSGYNIERMYIYNTNNASLNPTIQTNSLNISIKDSYFDNMVLNLATPNNKVEDCYFDARNDYPLLIGNSSDNIITNPVFGSVYTNAADMSFQGGGYTNCVILNPTFGGTVDIRVASLAGQSPDSKTKIQNYNATANDHRIFKPEGLIQTSGATLTDTTTKTAGQLALKFNPYNNKDISDLPLFLNLTKAVKASSSVNLYGFLRKNSSYGSATRPKITLTSGNGGIDTSYTMTDVDDTWEAFTLSGTAGAMDTFVTIKIETESANTGAAAYLADCVLSVGNVSTGSATSFKVGTIWVNGSPTVDDTLGGSVDGDYLAGKVWSEPKTDYTTADTFGKIVSDTEKKVDDAGAMSLM
jgi:hypothetical protein